MTTTTATTPRRCGRPPGRKPWTRESILAALVTYYKTTGHWPSSTKLNPAQLRREGQHEAIAVFDAGTYPGHATVRRFFGSVPAAIAEARKPVEAALAQREREIRERARQERLAAERVRQAQEQAAREAERAAQARAPAPTTFAELYRQATIAAGGVCPIEAGLILRLVDNECPHERLPFDASPPCGCFPQEGGVVVELPTRTIIAADAERRAA